MDDTRLPAHVEVAGLIRAVQAAGGFATVPVSYTHLTLPTNREV